MNAKRIVLYLLAHVVIAGLVAEDLRRQGKSEQEAQLGGHIAGSVSGLVLTRMF